MKDLVLTFEGMKHGGSITIPYYELFDEKGKTIKLKITKISTNLVYMNLYSQNCNITI